ncbi:MAG TPA: orotate phosphoribosyltransferase [Bryobacteraceae bacterium]
MPGTENDELSRLKTLLCAKSVRRGEVTLASGQKSDIYVDGKLTTYSAEAMPLVGRAFLRKMAALHWAPEAVGGLTLGADPIAFAVARESLEFGRPIDAFVIRKEPKKHGMQRFVEGLDETAGREVVILEDVCTTGGSTAQAIEKALAAHMRIVGAICLVDREMGGPALLREKFGIRLEGIFTLADLRNIVY